MLAWLRSLLGRRGGDDAHALSLEANIAADKRQVEEGLRLAERALAADAAHAPAHYTMGRLWEQAGRMDRAEASYRRALDLDPGHARAHNNLGCVLAFLERREEALACFRRALEIDARQPEANQNYAAMTSDAAAQEIAIQGYLEQIRSSPADTRALNNLANIYTGLGRYKEAMANLDRAIAIEPERAEAHYGRALILLAEGDYTAGWREYAWRWRLDSPLGAPARRFSQPMWDGHDLGKGALFMHGELALGEPVQFARYARLAAARCGSVIIECAPRIKPMIEGVAGVGVVTITGEALPPFAAHIPLYGLPRVFGTTLEDTHWNGPYVHADPARVAACKPMLESTGAAKLKVGLTWSGNPKNPYNRDRSVPPSALAPLLDAPGTAFYSLQKDGAADAGRLIDLTGHERDLLDTVAFISQLDLVITVDTMISALAGAMGKPVWVLLNLVPDWRHHLGRADNPWYPSMKLYRQPREGDWAPVIEQAAADLHRLAS
jgi:tetratricopeptide (TPR) repeat protein